MVETPSTQQESSWKIYSDPSVKSIVIKPTVEVIEVDSQIDKIKFSSGFREKATLSQIIIEKEALSCSRLGRASLPQICKLKDYQTDYINEPAGPAVVTRSFNFSLVIFQNFLWSPCNNRSIFGASYYNQDNN